MVCHFPEAWELPFCRRIRSKNSVKYKTSENTFLTLHHKLKAVYYKPPQSHRAASRACDDPTTLSIMNHLTEQHAEPVVTRLHCLLWTTSQSSNQSLWWPDYTVYYEPPHRAAIRAGGDPTTLSIMNHLTEQHSEPVMTRLHCLLWTTSQSSNQSLWWPDYTVYYEPPHGAAFRACDDPTTLSIMNHLTEQHSEPVMTRLHCLLLTTSQSSIQSLWWPDYTVYYEPPHRAAIRACDDPTTLSIMNHLTEQQSEPVVTRLHCLLWTTSRSSIQSLWWPDYTVYYEPPHRAAIRACGDPTTLSIMNHLTEQHSEPVMTRLHCLLWTTSQSSIQSLWWPDYTVYYEPPHRAAFRACDDPTTLSIMNHLTEQQSEPVMTRLHCLLWTTSQSSIQSLWWPDYSTKIRPSWESFPVKN